MRLTSILFSAIFGLSLIGCSQNSGDRTPIDARKLKEPLIDANKIRIEMESDQIDGYVNRRKWDVTRTGTGLRYFIYKSGIGDSAKEGLVARVNYEISLLDGTICYSTKESGSQDFLIGMDDVESGLHEGITYMREGDKAKLILPSHLAHGLIGDQDKIPAKATIIYDIELVELKK